MNFRVFVLTLLVWPILSCIKEPRASTPLGPQTTADEIEYEQYKSIAKLDPYSVQKNQRIHGIETIELISSQNPMKSISKEWTMEVTDVENYVDRRLLTTLKAVSDKADTDQFVYEIKNVYQIPQLNPLQVLNPLRLNLSEIKSYIDEQQNSPDITKQSTTTEPDPITGIAFHNLKSQVIELNPPPKVQESENCQGLTNCKISADKITYDVVFLFKSGKTQTHNVEWFISQDVPFFAGILKQCATTIISIESARVLVKQCSEVIDFKFSQN